jgi:hypothetical protein
MACGPVNEDEESMCDSNAAVLFYRRTSQSKERGIKMSEGINPKVFKSKDQRAKLKRFGFLQGGKRSETLTDSPTGDQLRAEQHQTEPSITTKDLDDLYEQFVSLTKMLIARSKAERLRVQLELLTEIEERITSSTYKLEQNDNIVGILHEIRDRISGTDSK